MASFIPIGKHDIVILDPYSDVTPINFEFFVWRMLFVPDQFLVDLFFVYFVENFDPISKPIFSFLFHFVTLSIDQPLLFQCPMEGCQFLSSVFFASTT